MYEVGRTYRIENDELSNFLDVVKKEGFVVQTGGEPDAKFWDYWLSKGKYYATLERDTRGAKVIVKENDELHQVILQYISQQTVASTQTR